MSEGAKRAIVGVVALLVGAAIGWLIARSAPAPVPLAGNKIVVVVGPDAEDVHPGRVPLSKQNRDEIWWISTRPGRDLVIESDLQLFEQQTRSASGRWAMTCAGRQCQSKAILDSTAYGEYKYWQIFRQNGQTVDEADGWIIIER